VRALASASGARLAVPASGGTPSANAASGAGTGSAGAGKGPASGGQPAAAPAPAPSGLPVPLIVAIAAGVLAAVALGGWLARRAGLRLPVGFRLRIRPVWRRPPRLAIPGTWLAGGFVGLAVVLIAVHALVQPSGGAAQGSVAGSTALAAKTSSSSSSTAATTYCPPAASARSRCSPQASRTRHARNQARPRRRGTTTARRHPETAGQRPGRSVYRSHRPCPCPSVSPTAPEPGTHGHIADSVGPRRHLEPRKRWSAAFASAENSGLKTERDQPR
jgi:hypothetical protein